jgi:threonylcarbamoyladenosine tRNA methylthiotransferase MtaB
MVNMAKTFILYSLGCKVNSYECSALRTLMLNNGYVEAKKGDNVDVAIINTCSVTATADQKSRQQIRKLKNKNPNAIICVMGCYSQGNHNYIKNDIGAHIIVGTSNRSKIPSLITKYLQNPTIFDETEENPRDFNYEELGVVACSENIRAYLKIQDGCDNFCSYCLIPYRRGKSRSRDFGKIIEEAKMLVSMGYKEIVLTGIHVGGYGKDLNGHTFSDLVEALSSIDNLYRLRISSIEESEIDDKLIELIRTKSNIAKHLHIPLQAGSDSV